MPKAEWRIFLPNEERGRQPEEVRALMALLDNSAPVVRTDIYVKADADVGVKRRGDGGLEFKSLMRRQALGGGVGPGAVETFSKVKLGEGATLANIIEHLRNQSGGISEELEALLNDPMEVTVEKAVRKTEVKTEDGKASFEVTEVTVSYPEMPEDYPKKWLTFCAEGSLQSVEAFVGSDGKPLVPLMSRRGALQVGYPQFVQMISS